MNLECVYKVYRGLGRTDVVVRFVFLELCSAVGARVGVESCVDISEAYFGFQVPMLVQNPGIPVCRTHFPAVLGRYLEGRTGPGQLVHTTAEAGHVLAPYLYGARNETVYILCLDAKEKALGVRRLSEGNIGNSDVTIRRAAEECLALRASFCYLAHNHVSGIALPSPADLSTTDVVRAALAPLGVRLVDHLVFVDGDLVSIWETAADRRGGYRMVYPGQQ